MKLRDGQVSNSSSSSFFIGIGMIKDIDSFRKMIKEKIDFKASLYNMDSGIVDNAQLLLLSDKLWELGCNVNFENNNKLSIVGSVNHEPEVSLPVNLDKEEYYFVFNVGNNEGDEEFMDGSNFDLDYNIDLDWFYGTQREIASLFESDEYFSVKDWQFGVARNG